MSVANQELAKREEEYDKVVAAISLTGDKMTEVGENEHLGKDSYVYKRYSYVHKFAQDKERLLLKEIKRLKKSVAAAGFTEQLVILAGAVGYDMDTPDLSQDASLDD